MKLKTVDCGIIGIVESWANDAVNDAELTLNGYNMFRIDKKEANGVGGGLLLYVKDKWQATCCTELTEYGFNQSLWCTVKVKTGKLLRDIAVKDNVMGLKKAGYAIEAHQVEV